MLAALGAALSGDAGWQVRVADTRFGLILMLAAGAAGAKGIALQLVRLDIDIDRAFDVGRDIDRGERRMPAGVGVERADADEPVHAGFTLQVAVGVIPSYED